MSSVNHSEEHSTQKQDQSIAPQPSGAGEHAQGDIRAAKHCYEAIVIGSGFGGQLAAINLIREGIKDFIILERRSFLGGTWSQNVYPGAAVDVPSPLYSLSFEPYDWDQLFADQSKLREYTHYIIDKYGLRNKVRLDSNVTQLRWDDKKSIWQVNVEGQSSYQARVVINASGPLSTPVIPDFPGRDTFKGKSFHSNNWDHGADWHGKRVAVVGSGASAAQIIPAIAPDVAHLHVFQRTPHWVMPRNDYRFKPWQRRLLKLSWAYYLLRYLIYWWYEFRVVGFKYSDTVLKLMGRNKAMRHIRKQIKDPQLQQKVTPTFTIGCKRVILSDTLYPALCRDNVTLHDKSDAIAKITEDGILTQNGDHITLDMIVYSTGYDATDGVISYPVIGKDGKQLSQVWADYPRAYLGTTIPGFPNLFIVTGPNTGIGHTSALFIIESQMQYIRASLRALKHKKAKAIEVLQAAEERYTQRIHKEMQKTVWQNGGCQSWYKSKSGKVIAMFPGFSFTYRRWAKRFKPDDHYLHQ